MEYYSHKKGQLRLCLASLVILLIIGCEAELKPKKVSEPNGIPEPIVKEESIQDSPTPTPTATPTPVPEVHYYNVDDYTYTIKGAEVPHSYLLTVFWPKTNVPLTISINKDVVKTVLPTELNSFSYQVADQTKIVLQILSAINEPLKEWIFETPKDFVFNSTENLSQNIEVKANRIFFKNKSLIETAGFNFTAIADEIFFDEGAKIINFENPPKVVPAKDGLVGGSIFIFARRASGKLNLALSGGDGGKGMTAFPYFPQAANGKDGVAGLCSGSGFSSQFCTQPAIDAEPSPSGHKGKQGFPGNKGGNSGSLTIEITEQSEVEFVHTEKPGSGGEGGEGGMGQLKGQPGKGIPRLESCLCDSAKDGEDTGKNGEHGDVGPHGPDGDVGPICISIGRGSGVCKH